MTTAQLTQLLISWSDINSGSENSAGLARMRAALAAEFARIPNALVSHLPLAGTEACALQVKIRPQAPVQILLSGHFDTVYGADHPFQRCVMTSPTHLNGPGVTDMKGGLVVMLETLLRFEKSKDAAAVGWEVLLTPDEEIGSPYTAGVIAAAARRHNFGLVFEPARSNGDLVRSRKGTGTFTLVCKGRAAHAGRDPAAGRNAILALAELLPQVNALNRTVPGIMLNVGSIKGGGAVNIVPDSAEAGINIRITAQDDAKVVLEALAALVAPFNAREGYSLEILGQFNRPPKEAGPNEHRLFKDWLDCAKVHSLAVGWQDVGGGSDGNLLSAAGLSSLDGVGIVGDHLHSPAEFADVSSIEPRVAVAVTFLERVAGGSIVLPQKPTASP